VALGGCSDGRIAGRRVGSCPFGPSGRAPIGFWQFRERADKRQHGGKGAPHPLGDERALVQAAFPGGVLVRDHRAGQPELGVGQEHQPGPAIGLLWVAHARGRPGGGSACRSGRGVPGRSAGHRPARAGPHRGRFPPAPATTARVASACACGEATDPPRRAPACPGQSAWGRVPLVA